MGCQWISWDFMEFDGFYGILIVFGLVLVVMRVLMESTVK